jgi:hypothetical protein
MKMYASELLLHGLYFRLYVTAISSLCTYTYMNKGHGLLTEKYNQLHTFNQEGKHDDSLRDVPP